VNGSFFLPNARSFDSWLALRVGVAVIAIWHDIKKRFQFFLIELIFTFFYKIMREILLFSAMVKVISKNNYDIYLLT